MKKLLSILVVTAFGLAACGGGGGATAATVNDTPITVGDVEALIDIEESNIPKEQFAQFLGFEIQRVLLTETTSEEFGIEIAEEDIDAEATRIYEESAQEGVSREDFLASNGVTEQFLRNIAQQGLLDQAMREELDADVADPTQDEIDQRLAAATTSLTEVCVSHILVATEEEAQEVIDRLEEGEDFGELATELSTDPGSVENEGTYPCTQAGGFAPEFRDASVVAPLGEVYDEIVQTQHGFHVLLVNDRTEPADADLPNEEDLVQTIRAESVSLELNEWFLEVVSGAEVSVEEQYGTWQTAPQPGVIPPVS